MPIVKVGCLSPTPRLQSKTEDNAIQYQDPSSARRNTEDQELNPAAEMHVGSIETLEKLGIAGGVWAPRERNVGEGGADLFPGDGAGDAVAYVYVHGLDIGRKEVRK